MADDSLKVSIKGDLEDLQSKVQQGERELAAFKLKAEANSQIKLRVDLAKYQSDLADARKQLSAFRKAGDSEGEIKTRINIEELQKKIRDGRGALKDLQGELGSTGRSFFSLNGIVTDAIKAFTGLQVIRSVSGLFRDAFNASVSFESAFAGVKKTVEATPQELAKLSDEFRQLAKSIPLPVEGLARIGELAGQLGIAKGDIIDFTKTIAKLGVTTNLTEEAAATSLARIANIFKQPSADVERFGSSIVALGNNFATTEQEIVNFATNIAGTGAAVGLSTQDIAALGAAFSSVGVEAEAGGTAVQKTLLTLNQAVVNGGKELDRFAEIAGTSASDFASLWKSAPIKAFDLFVQGLGKSGDQAANVLDELVGGDVRLTRAFLSLAQSGDLLTRTIDVSNTAFEANNALTKEAETRFNTADSKIKDFKASWYDLAITVGDFLVKVALPTLTFLTDLADSLAGSSDKFRVFSAAIKGAGIGLGTYFAGSTIIGIANGLKAFYTALSTSAVAAGIFGKQVEVAGKAAATSAVSTSLFSRAMVGLASPLGLASIAMAAIAAAFLNAKAKAAEFKISLDSLQETLASFGEGSDRILQISKDIETLTKKTVEAQQQIFALQSTGQFGPGFDALFQQQTQDIELLRASYVEYLAALGATPEKIDEITSSLGFFSSVVAPTNKELADMKDRTTDLGGALAELGENFADTATRFQQNVEALTKEGVTLTEAVHTVRSNMIDDFEGIADGGARMSAELIKTLVTTAAKTEGYGAAFTKGYALGLERDDVIAAVKAAGLEVTNPVLGTLLDAAVEAGDKGEVAALLWAAGIDKESAEGAKSAQNLADYVLETLVNNEANARAAGSGLGQASVGGVVDGIKKRFPALASAFNSILSVLQTVGGVGDIKLTGIAKIDQGISSLANFGAEILRKANSISEVFKAAQAQINSTESGVTSSPSSSGGGGAGGAMKEAEKKAKDAEKAVEDFNKQIEETGRQSELLKGKVKEFYGEIVDEIDKAREAQGLLNDELANFKKAETTGFVKDAARRDVDLANEQKDIEKEISDLSAKQATDTEDAQRIAEERNKLELELNDILKERKQIQDFITANPDQQGTFKAEQDLAGKSQFEQDKAAFDQRIAEKEAEVQAEIEKQQKIIDIRQRFLDIQAGQDAESLAAKDKLNAIAAGTDNLNAEERKKALQELGFGELTVQEQLDLLKQAQQAAALDAEKLLIEDQQAQILAVKEDYFKRAEDAHSLSVDAMKAKTQELIDIIRLAQIEQQKLNALARASTEGTGNTTNISIENNVATNVDLDAGMNRALDKFNP